jgi:ABC-type multidrug transport system ATPase subunit
VRDSYDVLAAMYKVEPDVKRKRLAELTELLRLDEVMDLPVRKCSLGQRMRADLAAALLHDPDVLFLDEPTIGLDAFAKRSIREFLRSLNREFGKTILLTTHDMDDIESLCNRVMVLNGGALAYDGSLEELRERIGLPSRMTLTFAGDVDAAACAAAFGDEVAVERSDGPRVALAFQRERIRPKRVLDAASALGDIVDIHMEEPEFEDVIRRIYSGSTAKYKNSAAEAIEIARTNAGPSRLPLVEASSAMPSDHRIDAEKKPERKTPSASAPCTGDFATTLPPTVANQRMAVGEAIARPQPHRNERSGERRGMAEPSAFDAESSIDLGFQAARSMAYAKYKSKSVPPIQSAQRTSGMPSRSATPVVASTAYVRSPNEEPTPIRNDGQKPRVTPSRTIATLTVPRSRQRLKDKAKPERNKCQSIG